MVQENPSACRTPEITRFPDMIDRCHPSWYKIVFVHESGVKFGANESKNMEKVFDFRNIKSPGIQYHGF
jgi:hypothetical protein